jgi:hypothetical protein
VPRELLPVTAREVAEAADVTEAVAYRALMAHRAHIARAIPVSGW